MRTFKHNNNKDGSRKTYQIKQNGKARKTGSNSLLQHFSRTRETRAHLSLKKFFPEKMTKKIYLEERIFHFFLNPEIGLPNS